MYPASVDIHDLGGTYMRYKRGQAKFTAWLREAAAKFVPKPAQVADAKTASAQTARQTKTMPNPQEKLDTRGLQLMAEIVADGSKVGDIPEDPINTLRDVVLLRKGCAGFYMGLGPKCKDAQIAMDNASHNHMILVLERILDKLEAKVVRHPKPSRPVSVPGLRPSKQENQVEEPAPSLEKELGTMFANLEVFPVEHDTPDNSERDEETGITPQRTHRASRLSKRRSKKSKKQRAPPPPVETEWEDDDDDDNDNDNDEDPFDVYMVIYCLFEDFNNIRDHIIEKWCDYFYADTDIRIETLAAITNAAYEIFHRMQEELERHPANASPDTNFGSYKSIIRRLLTSEVQEGETFEGLGEGIECIPGMPTFGRATLFKGIIKTDRVSDEARKIVKECDFTEETNLRLALRPWALMRFYFDRPMLKRDIPIPSLCPTHRNYSGLYGLTDPEDIWNLDWYTSQDFAQDLSLLRSHKTDGDVDYLLPAEPELNLDFQDAYRCEGFRTHDTVAFLFSLQLYLDIRRTLETRADEAFDPMQATALRVHTDLVRHLDHIHPTHTHQIYAPEPPSADPKPKPPPCPQRYHVPPLYTPPPPHDALARLFHRRIYELNTYFLRDPIHPPHSHYHESPHKFHLLKRDPVWAGLLTLRARLVAAKLGREAVERSAVVNAAACVYRAALAAAGDGGAGLVWEEMCMWIWDDSDVVTQCPEDKGVDAAMRVLESFRGEKGSATKEKCPRGAMEVLWERYGESFRSGKRHLGYLEEIAALPKRGEGRDDGWGTVSSGGQSGSNASEAEEAPGTLDAGAMSAESSTRTTGKDARLSSIEMLEALEEHVESVLDLDWDADYFALFEESVKMLKALVQSDLGEKYGLASVWTEGDNVERLAGVVVRLARVATGHEEREEMLSRIVDVVVTALKDIHQDSKDAEDKEEKEKEENADEEAEEEAEEEEDSDSEDDDKDDEEDDKDDNKEDDETDDETGDEEDPMDYADEYPGKLPCNTHVTVKKKGRWAMGWDDPNWKVVTVIGPQHEAVPQGDELLEIIWSTHELSEKYDRFMKPRKT